MLNSKYVLSLVLFVVPAIICGMESDSGNIDAVEEVFNCPDLRKKILDEIPKDDSSYSYLAKLHRHLGISDQQAREEVQAIFNKFVSKSKNFDKFAEIVEAKGNNLLENWPNGQALKKAYDELTYEQKSKIEELIEAFATSVSLLKGYSNNDMEFSANNSDARINQDLANFSKGIGAQKKAEDVLQEIKEMKQTIINNKQISHETRQAGLKLVSLVLKKAKSITERGSLSTHSRNILKKSCNAVNTILAVVALAIETFIVKEIHDRIKIGRVNDMSGLMVMACIQIAVLFPVIAGGIIYKLNQVGNSIELPKLDGARVRLNEIINKMLVNIQEEISPSKNDIQPLIIVGVLLAAYVMYQLY